MADSERPTPISYKWSIVTFRLSCTVFELFRCYIYNGISPSRANFWGFFAPHNPKFENSSTRPLKGTCCHQNTHFELSYISIRQSVWPVRVAMNPDIKKKKTKLWRQFHPFRGVPYPYRNFTIFGTCCHPHDVIISAKFHVKPFTRFGLARGRIFHFPLWKHCRLYNSLALPGRLWYI